MEFVNWKKENSEFEIILNRVEYDMVSGDNFDNNSVNILAFFILKILIFFLFERVMVWTCKLTSNVRRLDSLNPRLNPV